MLKLAQVFYMDLTHPDNLKSYLHRFHIRLSHKLGQNFLVDLKVLQDIINAAELNASDLVLEIGAGVGTVTVELAKRCRRVLAIEKDKNLFAPLTEAVKNFPNVQIVNEDILKVRWADLFAADLGTHSPIHACPVASADEADCYGDSRFLIQDYKVVANIPYYITGQIFRLLLNLPTKPKLIVMLVQKEVGERIVAVPGQMSVLAASVQFYGEPQIVATALRTAFYPPPEVDSAILKIQVYDQPKFPVSERDFFRLVKIGFSARRKTLVNNLAAGLGISKQTIAELLRKSDLPPNARAQELALDDWKRLYQILKDL